LPHDRTDERTSRSLALKESHSVLWDEKPGVAAAW